MLQLEQIDIKISHGDNFLDRMMPIILSSIDYMKKERPRAAPHLPAISNNSKRQPTDTALNDSGTSDHPLQIHEHGSCVH